MLVLELTGSNRNKISSTNNHYDRLFFLLAPLTSHFNVDKKVNFHKKHEIGHKLSPATTKPNISKTGRNSRCSERTFVPSSPSIPDYHVPRHVFKRMAERDYFGTSLPRQNTLY